MAILDRDIPVHGDWDAAEEEGKGFTDVISTDYEDQYVYKDPISLDWGDNSQDEENNCDSDRETCCCIDLLEGKLPLISLLDLNLKTFRHG